MDGVVEEQQRHQYAIENDTVYGNDNEKEKIKIMVGEPAMPRILWNLPSQSHWSSLFPCHSEF